MRFVKKIVFEAHSQTSMLMYRKIKKSSTLAIRDLGYKSVFILSSTEHELTLLTNVKKANDCWHFNIYEQDKYNIYYSINEYLYFSLLNFYEHLKFRLQSNMIILITSGLCYVQSYMYSDL